MTSYNSFDISIYSPLLIGEGLGVRFNNNTKYFYKQFICIEIINSQLNIQSIDIIYCRDAENI